MLIKCSLSSSNSWLRFSIKCQSFISFGRTNDQNFTYRVSKYRLPFLFSSLLINWIHYKFALGKILKSTHETIMPYHWILFNCLYLDRIIGTSFIINQIFLNKNCKNSLKTFIIEMNCIENCWYNISYVNELKNCNKHPIGQLLKNLGISGKNCYQTRFFFKSR